MKTLENRVALVTGAATGIGKAIALEPGRHGAHAIVNYLNQEYKAQAISRIVSFTN
jgi:NAD(P)-dependent dehydrogenase (short-subunit alcohol dehydrogenase family)